MKKNEIDIPKELRLVVCGWCFTLALWIAPKDDPEGLIIIESIHNWASKSAAFITKQFTPTTRIGRTK